MLTAKPGYTIGRSRRSSRARIPDAEPTNFELWQQRLKCLGAAEARKSAMMLTGFHSEQLELHEDIVKQFRQHIKDVKNGLTAFMITADTANAPKYHFSVSLNTLWAANEYASCLFYRALGGVAAANKNVELAILTVRHSLKTNHIPMVLTANMSEWRHLDKCAEAEQISFANYSELFLSSVIVNPRSNYKSCYQLDKVCKPDGEVYLLRRMNHADTFVDSNNDQRFDDYLYYHLQVQQPISAAARTAFLALDPLQLVNDWLYDIQRWQASYRGEVVQQCANGSAAKLQEKLKKTQEKLPQQEVNRLIVAQPILQQEIPARLINRLLRAQHFLIANPNATHAQLLHALYPQRNFNQHAQHYASITAPNSEGITPPLGSELQAQLQRPGFPGEHLTYDLTSAAQLRKFDSLKTVKSEFWLGNYGPIEVLEKLGVDPCYIRDFSRNGFKRIIMSDKSLTDRWLDALLKVMPLPPVLEEIDLSHNQLTEQSALKIRKLIAACPNLKFVNMVGNYFADDFIPSFDLRSPVPAAAAQEAIPPPERLTLNLEKITEGISLPLPSASSSVDSSVRSSERLSTDGSTDSVLSESATPSLQSSSLSSSPVSPLSMERVNLGKVLRKEGRHSLSQFFSLNGTDNSISRVRSDTGRSIPSRSSDHGMVSFKPSSSP